MKLNILSAIRLTLVCIIFFCGVYTVFIWIIALASPGKGKGESVMYENRIVGYKLLGQKFTDDKYFNSRPSAVDYNASGSGGSNKGPFNPEYLKTIHSRIDSFLLHNKGISVKDIPSDMLTASGSGLDPDISPAAAYVQVNRISRVRSIPGQQIRSLIENHIEKPLAGLFGVERINVLKLNMDLDHLK